MYEEVEHLVQSAAGVSLREKEEEEERNREGEERSAEAAEQEDREEEDERGGGYEREEQEEEKEEGKEEEGKEEEGGIIPPGENGIGGVFSHGGKFAVYDLYDNIFEVSSKYRPPLIPIGRGAYGVVCSAFNKETNEHVAIKKIPTAFDNHIDAKRTLREIKLLRHLDHDNVLGAKDIIPPPSLQDFNDVYLVFELMDTDLQQIIRSEQALSEDHCKYFLYQILRGLKYIHSANILHRDLKPSNLLLNANCDLRICDFGLARTLSETEYMTEYVVTRWYRAPELLLNSTDYTGAIDVWSVGCIYMELLLREPLIPGRDYVHQLKSIIELLGTPVDSDTDFVKSLNAKRYLKQLPRYRRKPFSERFPQLSPLAVDLMQKMLAFNPRKRITVEEALAHPYLSGFRDEADEPVCHSPFKLDYNEHSITTEEIKEIIYKDALELNPQLRQ